MATYIFLTFQWRNKFSQLLFCLDVVGTKTADDKLEGTGEFLSRKKTNKKALTRVAVEFRIVVRHVENIKYSKNIHMECS